MTKMSKEPWLDALSDDWVSQPASPSSSMLAGSSNLSPHRSQLASSQSRIPILTHISSHSSPVNQAIITRQSPLVSNSPQFSSAKKHTPLRRSVPALDASGPTPKHRATSKHRSSSFMKTESSLKSASKMSSVTDNHGTVQIKVGKGNNEQDTPEWRRRLVRGEMPADEQCDLFAPLSIENIFKPPNSRGSAPLKTSSAPSLTGNFRASTEQDRNGNEILARSEANLQEGKKTGVQVSGISIVESQVDAVGGAGSLQNSVPRRSKTRTSQYLNSDIQVRTTSGQEDLRNERITPIFLSRSNTGDCRSTSEVLKSALKQLNGKLKHLSLYRDPSDPEARDSIGENQQDNDDNDEDIMLRETLLDTISQSLPTDLSMGTPIMGTNRILEYSPDGGYSNEGSFQKQRLIRPSISLFPPHDDLSRSKFKKFPPPRDAVSPTREKEIPSPTATKPAPAVLFPSQESEAEKLNPAEMRSSGTPLKLFGNHDTFTNNKLLRRMSQFEETLEGISESNELPSPCKAIRRKRGNYSLPNLRRGAAVKPSEQPAALLGSQGTEDHQMNRFGNGQLDDFDFSDTASHQMDVPRKAFDDKDRSPWSYSRASRRDRLRRSKSLDSTPEHGQVSRVRGPRSHRPRTTMMRPPEDDLDMKRIQNSPTKESASKRRRTSLRGQDRTHKYQGNPSPPTESMGELSLPESGLNHHSIDEREQLEAAERTGTPTPSQKPIYAKRSVVSKDHSFDVKDVKMKRVSEVVDAVVDESRRGSITTQDFLNEATKIMSMIRAKGRPKNGLTSVEESEMESLDEGYDDSSFQESSQENLSRPPSRDGLDLRKLRQYRLPNPRIISHLRKFEDKDDMELFMCTSMMSLHLDKDRERQIVTGSQVIDDRNDHVLESSPQTIRTCEYAPTRHKRTLSPQLGVQHRSHDIQTINTQVSSNSTSGRSIPSHLSSGSNAKGIIQSNMISHLIPEHVNGMMYNHSSHTWVKNKAGGSMNKSKGDDSEEDPFRGIPDLSVDELEEMMRIQRLASPDKNHIHLSRGPQTDGINSQPSAFGPENKASVFRPRTQEGEASNPDSSSVQSKFTRFTSSGPRPETRATSWGTGDVTVNSGQHAEYLGADQRTLDAEHEIKLHEGRIATLSRPCEESLRRPRVVTISFSSPLVSHIAYSSNDHALEYENISKTSREGSIHSRAMIDNVSGSAPNGPAHFRPSKHNNAPSRHASFDGRFFIGRPISRIDEQNEESTNDLSLIHLGVASGVTSTPIPGHREKSIAYSPGTGHGPSYSFHLTPLDDFTVDQVDDPLKLEVSYIAQRTRPSSLRQVHGTFALATEDLVKHITDAEPYEPYWEYIRHLTLNRKGLVTLYKLNDFCSRLEELDVSDNDIGQLSGAPSSIRSLKIQRNCISSLTAWGHLVNLQYLDVSGNELESLDSFSALIHLRELRASNNKIRNIDGILDLNGLLSLKLRNNMLTTADFEGAELSRLNDLDLSRNELIVVRNLEFLPALQSIDLSSNQIRELCSRPLRSLRSLRLSSNRLTAIDVAIFPSLTLLYLDQNFLSKIDGLDKCRHLGVLSVREQMSLQSNELASAIDLDLNTMKDIRKLFLSSNRLSEHLLSPSAPVLSLQLLDVASCALPHLPSRFSTFFPNLRVLNLNFNALIDVGELTGLKGLSRLTLVGNRISKLRRLCQVLNRLGRIEKCGRSSLTTIDLRGNPLTVGFYPALSGNGYGQGRPRRLELQRENGAQRKKSDDCGAKALASIGRVDIAHPNDLNHRDEDDAEPDVEIDDPYTLPSADIEADRKYLSCLDESTKLRRLVLELMLYVGTGGAIRILDGLELRSALQGSGPDTDRVRSRLEELGVLQKRPDVAQ